MTTWSKQRLGSLVLSRAIELLRDKREAEAKQIFDRLLLIDVIDTEEMWIIIHAKSILMAGKELNVENLRASILGLDPGGFILMFLDQHLVKENFFKRLLLWRSRKSFSLQAHLQLLINARTLSRREKIEAAGIASAILRGDLSVTGGFTSLVEIGRRCVNADRQLFTGFEMFLNNPFHFPIGTSRVHWNREALAQQDAELAAYEAEARQNLAQFLQKIASWSDGV